VAAGERLHRAGVLERDVVERVVGDVFADPLLAAAVDPDRRRDARELGRGRELMPLELVALDLERNVGEPREGAQRVTLTLALPGRWPNFVARTG
jgi:hypothetical protein